MGTELLTGRGPGSMSIEEVAAARGGIGKMAIYRRWPSRRRAVSVTPAGWMVPGLIA